MSSIAIDHLGRDELFILLNRVAARLAILPDNPAPTGTRQTPIFYGYRSHATPNDISRSSVATNDYWRPWYEAEHDPWNAHLRSEHSASSSGATVYTRQISCTDTFLSQLLSRCSWRLTNKHAPHRCNDVQV